jgi:hypothetical protein
MYIGHVDVGVGNGNPGGSLNARAGRAKELEGY